MKRFFLFVCLNLVISTHSVCGVYLKYEDEGDSKRRHILIDFRETEEAGEDVGRIRESIAGKAISFTESDTIQEVNDGNYTYTRKERDFFTSPAANTFIKWIEDSDELISLQFIAIDKDHHLVSVEQALILIAKKRKLFLKANESYVVNKGTSFCESDGIELFTIHSTPKKCSLDLWTRFKHVTITCAGKKGDEARQKAKALIESHYRDIKRNIVVE